MAAKYNFRKTILHRLEICWNVLTHKTFIAYTTDDIGDKWSLINNIESLEEFGQWLASGGYKKNSNYKEEYRMKKRNKKKMIKSLWRAGAIGYDKDSDTCFIVAKVIGKIEICKKSRIVNVCRINPLHLSEGTPSHVTDYENCRLATEREKDRYFALMYDYFDRNKELAYETEVENDMENPT